jgi:hypothetical protein
MSTPDLNKIINPSQLGGIESYVIHDGDGRGVRALEVNTGAGLRYRVLVDRGLDIDHAFFNHHSLTFLTQKGPTPPRPLDTGIDWLKGFPGGLLTSCGPTHIGPPVTDQGEQLGLHGPHSNTPAALEQVLQPDPRRNRTAMTITGVVRYGRLFGHNLELRRTILSRLGENSIEFADQFYNAGPAPAPHAWLLHINFGYPLLDEGSEFCYAAEKVEPRNDPASLAGFANPSQYKKMQPPPASGPVQEIVAYLYPRADEHGDTTVGIVNRKLELGVAVHYNTAEFPRCGNWQNPARHEYVAALEPMNGTVDGRDKDRARGFMDTLTPGQSKTYRYSLEVVSGPRIQELLSL